ncbi:MAG TPA: glycosyl hydrolase [Gemmatimonadaceae bacterium]|nr:glycosyl hydrolase [Gemmatimonadaceae bacterium]
MRVRHRVLLTMIVVGAALVGSVALTSVSSTAEGPVSGALSRLGATFGTFEHAMRGRFQGPGRAADLEWLDAYRVDRTKLKNPDVVLFGAFDSGLPSTLDGVVKLEQALGTTFPLVQIYSAWGDRPDQDFPIELVTAISDVGSIPVITWEPWLSDFGNDRHPQIPLRDQRDRHGMAAVASGQYDFFIDAWAADAARFSKPIFIRLGHEMNDPYRYPWGPQNNTNLEYIAAWKHVVDRFRHAGANNVLWVWSPHVAYEYWETYYPGSDYVDWVATGALNFGPIAQWSRWWDFEEIFGRKYDMLASFQKPVMVAEFGSLAVGGDRASWYGDALTDLRSKYPAVRAVLFFNVKDDQTVTYQRVDWTIDGDSAVLRALRPLLKVRPLPNV